MKKPLRIFKQNKFIIGFVTLVIFSVLYAISSKFYILNSGFAFTGPSTGAGSGSGAMGVDASNNISVGTSVTRPETKFLIVASSSAGTTDFALKALKQDSSPILVVRNDGTVGIATTTPNAATLTVQGTIFATGGLAATVAASNVTAGIFGGAGSGALYAFPSSLGVATSSQVGLPQPLSVYGNAYVSNKLSVGTTTPTSVLTVNGAIRTLGNSFPDNGFLLHSAGDTLEYGALYASSSPQVVILTTSGSGPLTFQVNGGNVGIGTISPAYVLDVVGGVRASATSTFSGNVGIGTTAPGYKLDVAGDINVTSSGAVYRRLGVAGLTVTCPAGQVLSTTTVSGGIVTGGSCVALTSGAITSLNALTASSQTLTTSSASGFNIASAGSAHTFSYPSKIIRIATLATTTGNLLVGGNTNGWDVLGVGANGTVLTASSTAANGVSWETVAGGIGGSGTANTVPLWTAATTLGNSLFTQGASSMGIGSGGLTVGTTTNQSAGAIFATGNITTQGIFLGNIAASNVTTGVFGGAGSGSNYGFPANLGINTSTAVGLPANLTVYGTSQYTATSTFLGNVGIGTTAPSYKLDVSTGGIRTNGTSSFNGNISIDGGGFRVGFPSQPWIAGGISLASTIATQNTAPSAAANKFGGLTDFLATTTYAGNLVVNQGANGDPNTILFNVPADAILVNSSTVIQAGSANYGGNADIYLYGDTTNEYLRMASNYIPGDNGSTTTSPGILANNDNLNIGTLSASKIIFRPNSATSTAIVMDASGRLGIGTASPTSKLQVVGLPVYANNAAAVAGGLTVGAFYRTGGDPDLVAVVH